MLHRSVPSYLRRMWEGQDTAAGARDSTAQFRPGYRFLQRVTIGVHSRSRCELGLETLSLDLGGTEGHLPIVTRDSSFLPKNRTFLERSLPGRGDLPHEDGRLRM